MRRHTLIGERILTSAPALRGGATLVRSSHEAFDGSGYPDGLAGDAIPVGSRMIAVCDAFDAMTSSRPYSPPRTSAEALEELRRCAGTQFDPTIVTAFEQVMVERAQAPVTKAREPHMPGRRASMRPWSRASEPSRPERLLKPPQEPVAGRA